ncbi:MAG: hypothetical protein ABF537_06930, partial [Acetobacter sp.]|uniref:hypothetical protein n=1 Tax=Acetobacter sp. TaxID=440 RepID=UPI0039ECA41B
RQLYPLRVGVGGGPNMAIGRVRLAAMGGGRATIPSLGVGMVALVLGSFLLHAARGSTCRLSA